MRIVIAAVAGSLLLHGCSLFEARPVDRAALAKEVEATERAFAKTMSDRDFAAFQAFLSDETVFFGAKGPLRGKAVVAERWKRFYDKGPAPFSWAPDTVEVLDSGTLALTSGPVHDAAGKLIGTFTSIWRQDAPGEWHIVFDKGCDVCDCGKK
jgi:ketosteroid isomerase-like protein